MTGNRKVSVECATLKTDLLGTWRLFCKRQSGSWLQTVCWLLTVIFTSMVMMHTTLNMLNKEDKESARKMLYLLTLQIDIMNWLLYYAEQVFLFYRWQTPTCFSFLGKTIKNLSEHTNLGASTSPGLKSTSHRVVLIPRSIIASSSFQLPGSEDPEQICCKIICINPNRPLGSRSIHRGFIHINWTVTWCCCLPSATGEK